ncbi:hypothetical protein Dpoa2040_002598 [Dickeya sp. CFBP 2040]|uniref:hypothetical protein n=1 Tax=Dickeya sp. CFBP 2040 TaxID=2718531 RepID=UPI001448065E|nr:hypothetical protein [Dickeya sp. CFBP 2040]NKI75310.1 hypothetical protein [Dickeya sp. CFBP 2040]
MAPFFCLINDDLVGVLVCVWYFSLLSFFLSVVCRLFMIQGGDFGGILIILSFIVAGNRLLFQVDVCFYGYGDVLLPEAIK